MKPISRSISNDGYRADWALPETTWEAAVRPTEACKAAVRMNWFTSTPAKRWRKDGLCAG